jgi:DNA-binding CsgD family transcriptional regulator
MRCMARLSKAQERTRQQILQLEGLDLTPAIAGSKILSALQSAVSTDSAVLFGVDPTSLLFNRMLAHSGGLVQWQNWLQKIYLVGEPLPELSFPGLMRANLAAVGIHDYPQTSLGIPRSALEILAPKDWWRKYHDIATPTGGILRACFGANGRWVAALELTRQESRRSFQAGEVSFIRWLAPMIGRVLHLAYQREQVSQPAAMRSDISGILVLGTNGQIQVCTPAAETWLQHLGDSGSQGGNNLPTAIWAAIARLRSNAGNSPASHLYVWTPVGNLRIEASQSRVDGSTALLLAPEHPPIPPDLPLHWQLTPQERQVVLRVVQGLSNQQIATAFTLSEHTIESHLSHVYEKLSVHSRSELLACLFRDVYWPKIQPTEVTTD